jgi:hypothetical protein
MRPGDGVWPNDAGIALRLARRRVVSGDFQEAQEPERQAPAGATVVAVFGLLNVAQRDFAPLIPSLDDNDS